MNRRTPLARKAALTCTTPLTRSTPLTSRGTTPSSRMRRPARKNDGGFAEAYGRKIVKARSGGVCEIDGLNPATEWHHRKNRSQGGTWDPANGLHLCTRCHQAVTDTRGFYYEMGWCVKRDQDPADVKVLIRVPVPGKNTTTAMFVKLTSQGGRPPAAAPNIIDRSAKAS